jgi:hypothetical protein
LLENRTFRVDVFDVRAGATIWRVVLTAAVLLACSNAAASAASGTISSLDGMTNAMAVGVDFTTSGSIATYQLERQAAPVWAGVCGTFGAWTAVGPLDPSSPYLDGDVTDATCVRYRLRITDTSSTTTYITATSTTLVDRSAPMSSIDALPPNVAGFVTFSGTMTDAATGILRGDLTFTGSATGTACAGMIDALWSCTFDTTIIPDGWYDLQLLVIDANGNFGVPVSLGFVVDNSPPVVAPAQFIEGVNPQAQHSVGTTIYVNPAVSGSFTVHAGAWDTGSGVNDVTFPVLGSGWTPSSPVVDTSWTSFDATYSFSPGASQPGSRSLTAHDLVGNAASAVFDVIADATPPAPGTATVTGSGTATLTFAGQTDAQSGIASRQVQRQLAPYAAGSCGAFGGWSAIGGSQATSPFVDLVPGQYCAQYRLHLADNVGNSTYVMAIGTVHNGDPVDTTSPTGTIDITGPIGDSAVLFGTSTDVGSGVASVALTATGPSGSELPVCSLESPSDTVASWSCPWNTLTVSDGMYVITAVVTDAADNSTTVTRALVIDNDAPTASFANFVEGLNPQYQHAVGSTMYINPTGSGSFQVRVNAADTATGIYGVMFPGLGAGWSPTTDQWDTVMTPATAMYSWTAPGVASPGVEHAVAQDVAGHTTQVAFSVATDTTHPQGGPGSVVWSAATDTAHISFPTPTDADSGMALTQLERRSAVRIGASTCDTFGSWSTIAAPLPATTYADTAVDTSGCYEYRLVAVDNVGNSSVFAIDGATSYADASADPDVPNITVDASTLDVAESGATTATVNITLATQPTADVVVHLDDAPSWQITLSDNDLVFTPYDWNFPHAVVVSAIDDLVSEAAVADVHIAITSWSTDPIYNPAYANDDLVVHVHDNDASGVQVSNALLHGAEAGATDTFYVALSSQPTADVTITLLDDDWQVMPSTYVMTFTAANWQTPQTVELYAVDDFIAERLHTGTITPLVTSLDPMYDGFAVTPITMEITDNDLEQLVMSTLPSAVAERGTTSAAFSVSLGSQPTGPVTVTIGGDAGQVTTSPTSLTFDATNWLVAQTITVTAIDDVNDEADPHVVHLTLTSTSSDARYAALAVVTHDVLVADDDEAASPLVDADPPTGGSISVPDVTIGDPPDAIAFVVGTDSGSGVASWAVQRRVAGFAIDQCGSFSPWSAAGGQDPTSPMSVSFSNNVCVQYRLVVTDAAGNVATWNGAGTIRVDRTAPFGAIAAMAGTADSPTASGSAMDATSSVVVAVDVDGPTRAHVCDHLTVTSGGWTCSWDATALPGGTYTVTATITDRAGNSATMSTSWTRPLARQPEQASPTALVVADTTAPTVTITELAPSTTARSATLRWSASDDSGAAPTVRVETRTARVTGGWSAWKVAPVHASPATLRAPARGSTICARVVASDGNGNTSTSESTCTATPVDDRSLRRSGSWLRITDASSFAHTLSVAPRRGAARLDLAVGGWQTLRVVARTCPKCGSVRVFAGRRLVATISLRSARTTRHKLLSVPGIRTSATRISIRAVRNRGQVAIDGLLVVR